MKARKRRFPEPLNFTPDDKGGREPPRARPLMTAAEPRSRAPTAAAAVSASGPARPAPRDDRTELGISRHAYLAAALATAAWAGMLAAYTLGYVGGWSVLVRAPAELAITALLAVLPGLFVFAAAFAARQGARLASEARWVRGLSEELVAPTALAAVRTHDLVGALRQEVERAAAAAAAAHDQLAAVRTSLAAETDRLTETAADAQRTARAVGDTLSRERDAVTALIADLNAGADGLAEGVERQSRLVADASDLARSQLQEAEATLAAAAAGVSGAGSDVAASAVNAGETLTRQSERLDVAAAALSERLRFLDARLSEQRSGLGALAKALEADEEEVAVRLEGRRAQFQDVLAEGRAGAEALDRAVEAGAATLRSLVQTAGDQVRQVSETARAGRAALAAEAREAEAAAHARLQDGLAALGEAGAAARAAAEQHLAAARAQVDQLGQAAYDAGQRANHAFDGHVADAQRLIEQAAALVEEAGRRTAERVAAGVQASRETLQALTGAVEEVDARVAALPDTARRQVQDVRDVVEQGLAGVAAAARSAVAETQAVDQAFQDRIRRNYETLSEAVKLMGRVAGAVDFGRVDLKPAPPPAALAPAAAPARVPVAATPGPAPAGPAMVAEPAAPSPEPEGPGLRPRLKFTPTVADQALKAVFEPTARPAAPDSELGRAARPADAEGWTWKDLLSSMEDLPVDDDGLGERMVRQLEALGVDTAALLPSPRVEELARAFLAGDASAARDTLRRIAPAAVRRLSRHVLSERDLREPADRFLARYQDRLRSAAEAEGGLRTAVTLLASDAGRAFLLLDAAVGDL